MSSSSTTSSQSRLYHLYLKLQNHIQDDGAVADLMVDIRTLISQAVAERTSTNAKIDHVAEVFGNTWREHY